MSQQALRYCTVNFLRLNTETIGYTNYLNCDPYVHRTVHQEFIIVIIGIRHIKLKKIMTYTKIKRKKNKKYLKFNVRFEKNYFKSY